MAAALIKPTPPRLSLAFATALTLHVLAALTLPNLKLLFDAATSSRNAASAPLPLPPPQATTPTGEVIPIRLPLAGFRMQTELGAVARDNPQLSSLPIAPKALAGKFAMSMSLDAAANEALAADQRAHPKPPPMETTRLVAELRLASGNGAGTSKAPSAAHAKAPQSAATPPPKPVEPVKPPPTQAPPAKIATPPMQPLIQPPIRPLVYPPVQAFHGAGQENIAVAPPMPASGLAEDEMSSAPPLTAGNALALGAQAAPDRGPGEQVSGRGLFFQRLTSHLFLVNQQALADAIRATPRLTVEVRFTMDRSGRVLDAQVMRSTGEPALDEKATDVIMRASPMPQMAPDMPQSKLELSFPVQIYR
jgi:protein TonB